MYARVIDSFTGETPVTGKAPVTNGSSQWKGAGECKGKRHRMVQAKVGAQGERVAFSRTG
jgi:hypothetical protein